MIIYWFRQDLRIADNPALTYAAQQGEILPIYILDDENALNHKMGEASRWWLHHALSDLNHSLNQQLAFYQGDAKKILLQLVEGYHPNAVVWNRCYEPWRTHRDSEIKSSLKALSIETHSFNGSLLWEPWQILKSDSTPYKVFTPFYRKGCLSAPEPRIPIDVPTSLTLISDPASLPLDALQLLPKIPWGASLKSHWNISEAGAQQQLKNFITDGIVNYKEGRNFPAQQHVSRLSPYLHFGQISPNQAWWAARSSGNNVDIETFCSELAWREFSYHLLYHHPDLPEKNLQTKFNAFPWKNNSAALKRWQKGLTGFPIVDAGMRELWQTGYMHNRVRMIVGSFLVKNLLIDWRHGERWFWDCLVDADLANNSASWQWIAGCGADAAPYFRIFNPVTQGQKFDPTGEYIRKFVPELNLLPNDYLFAPWEAPPAVLAKAGITLGQTYPSPIVDLQLSRKLALEAFAQLRSQ